MLVEPQFIRSVLPFHLSVVAWRCNSDTMVFYPHFEHSFFKQRLVLWLGYEQCIRKLCPIVCLDHPDRKRCSPDQFFEKVFCAGGAMLGIHLPVCPACAFVLCGELIVFLPVCYAISRHILHIHLDFLSGIFCPLVWLILSNTLSLLLGLHQFWCCSLKTAIASWISIRFGFLESQ